MPPEESRTINADGSVTIVYSGGVEYTYTPNRRPKHDYSGDTPSEGATDTEAKKGKTGGEGGSDDNDPDESSSNGPGEGDDADDTDGDSSNGEADGGDGEESDPADSEGESESEDEDGESGDNDSPDDADDYSHRVVIRQLPGRLRAVAYQSSGYQDLLMQVWEPFDQKWRTYDTCIGEHEWPETEDEWVAYGY